MSSTVLAAERPVGYGAGDDVAGVGSGALTEVSDSGRCGAQGDPAAVTLDGERAVRTAGADGRESSDALAQIRAGIAALADEDLESLDARGQADRLEEVNRLRNLLDAEMVRGVGHFDQSGAFEPVGAASTASWLRGWCRLGHGEAGDHTTVARRLAALPATAAALASGDIGLRHAKVIARAATQERLAAIVGVEDRLVDAARRMHPGLVARLVREVRGAVDHHRGARDANDAHAARYAFLSPTIDGMVAVNALLDAEGGQTLLTAIDALMAPDPADTPRQERRSPAQRRADALAEIARQALDADVLPDVAGRRPHVTITVDLDTLEARATDRGHAAVDWPTLRARLASGEPISAATARRIACDAEIAPLIFSDAGQVLHLGRTRRNPSVSLRRALDARDQGCRGPNCHAPVRWTQTHHAVYWADGGPTDPTNCLLLCWRCHRRVHEGGWHLTMTDTGTATFTDPWQRTYTTHPPRRTS